MDKIIRQALDPTTNDNILFVTGQCNNHCLMCCQPPDTENDIENLYSINIKRVKDAPQNTKHLAITGGEPTLLGDKLISLIGFVHKQLPNTLIHILSNGRAFSNSTYTSAIVEAGGGMLSLGIPLHSDYEKDHNIIAGNSHAYVETMNGLYNLAMNSVPIEIRIVINCMNYMRLTQMSQFILKNLSFIEWVSFMGMERIGLAQKNANLIWKEPIEYSDMLVDACNILEMAGYDARIYNIPLCLLPINAYKYAYQSISDWKRSFSEVCNNCMVQNRCCGLFSTSFEPFAGIRPIQNQE